MNCRRCDRPLSNPTPAGLGNTCRKHKSNELTPAKTIRVAALFTRYQARRRYLVLTVPRVRVLVEDRPDGRFAVCDSCNGRCEHVEAVASTDNKRFPQG